MVYDDIIVLAVMEDVLCVFLCFLEFSQVLGLAYKYVHFQRLTQFVHNTWTMFLLSFLTPAIICVTYCPMYCFEILKFSLHTFGSSTRNKYTLLLFVAIIFKIFSKTFQIEKFKSHMVSLEFIILF